LDRPNTPVTRQTLSASSTFQPPDEAVEDVSEEEIKDELYCIMTTTVAGIQYYNGWQSDLSTTFLHSSDIVQVWLGQGRKFS
jgi:hypothetical protein